MPFVFMVLTACSLLVSTGIAAPAERAPHTTASGLSPLVQSGRAVAGSSVDRLLRDPRISESSGLVRSTRRAGFVVTHNDSGDSARLFVVGPRGHTRATVTVGNAGHLDWEDLSAGPRHTLWIGDIGDNAAGRSSVTVYRLVEPRGLGRQRVRATRFHFTYPDGPHDAETLMVDPRTSRVHIVTKVWPGTGAVYVAPRELRAGDVHRLTRLRSAPGGVTAGDFSPGGARYALRDYSQAFVYRRGAHVRTMAMPEAQQAESLTWADGGGALLSGTEGEDSPIHRVELP